jgi:2-polyprenyl-3-methyl-5-hydroxy-6-metoxy-1,4-benzoquinol methylase
MTEARSDDRSDFVRMDAIQGYGLWAESYDTDPNPLIVLEEPVTRELLGDVRGLRVLDVGCGTGRHIAWLVEQGAEVVGIDASPEMLQRARTRLSGASGVTFRVGCSIDQVPRQGRFDLVLCALMLCHCSDLSAELAGMAKALQPGGRLVVSDLHPVWPESGHDYSEFDDRTGREVRIACFAHPLGDYRRIMEAEGLVIEQVREPRIDATIVARFPPLAEFEGVPLALVLSARKDR